MIRAMTPNLMVESVEETIEFYQNILGFSVADSVTAPEGHLQFVILVKDNYWLMFQERRNLISECPSLTVAKTQPSATLYMSVDNFDEMYKNIKSKVALVTDIHITFYDAEEFAIADNTGYIITIARHKPC